jgi:hypothetical protein
MRDQQKKVFNASDRTREQVRCEVPAVFVPAAATSSGQGGG